jgi:site-specific recombinase XerD
VSLFAGGGGGNPDLTTEWLRWLRDDRGRAANTIATYARTLRTLTVNPATATPEDIEAWWRTRANNADGEPRPHSARNNELSALRGFYHWAARFGHRTDDPTIRLDLLRQQKRISRFIGNDDLRTLLDGLPPDLRRAVALGAYGGLRVSEAATLDWRDIDQDTRRMIVRGKGDKERSVGLPFVLLDVILPNKGGNVVTGGEPYATNYLQTKVNAAIRSAGVDATFHKLRHRFGFKAAEAGVAPTSIARAMGHESLTTTMGYIAAMDSDLDLIADAVSR